MAWAPRSRPARRKKKASRKPTDITDTSPEESFDHLKIQDDVQSGIDVIVGGPPCQAYSIVGRAKPRHMIRLPFAGFQMSVALEADHAALALVGAGHVEGKLCVGDPLVWLEWISAVVAVLLVALGHQLPPFFGLDCTRSSTHRASQVVTFSPVIRL